ncbi:MAG: hypothetical protein KF716_29600 [Anaerolineae bacterium]|nr:hypothetical protein [Anaerolineae bacterium]
MISRPSAPSSLSGIETGAGVGSGAMSEMDSTAEGLTPAPSLSWRGEFRVAVGVGSMTGRGEGVAADSMAGGSSTGVK